MKQSQEELQRLWNHNKQLLERLKVTEGQLEASQEIDDQGTDLRRLKKKYLSIHGEKTQLSTEKVQLLEKLDERDLQLKELREKLSTDDQSQASLPNVQRSLSVGEALSPEDPRAEVDRLRGWWRTGK